MQQANSGDVDAAPMTGSGLRAGASALGRCGFAAFGVSFSERLSPHRLEAYRSALLRRLVAHATANVPYYRRLFERHGLSPHDIRGTADLTRIPVTTRADLQQIPPADLVARGLDPGRLAGSTTSGSTGRPVTVRRSWLDLSLLYAFRLRGYRRMGVRLRDHDAVLARVMGRKSDEGKAIGNLLRRAGMLRHSAVSLFDEPEVAAARLAAIAPDVVRGFPTTLGRLAEALRRRPQPALRPHLVIAMGEVLTARARATIEAGFGAPVREEYGCQEVNQIAWQCPASGLLHTADDAVITEVRNGATDAAPGESGEVVTTSLYQYATPLLRYAPGDRAERGPAGCACGTSFGSLAAVTGRSLDFFRLPDGRVLHPYSLVNCFIGDPWIRQYQLEQQREDRVELRIVPGRTPTPDQLSALTRALADVLGDEVEVAVEVVGDIPPDPSGKLRPSRSLVPW